VEEAGISRLFHENDRPGNISRMLLSGKPFRMPDNLLPDRIIRALSPSDDPMLDFNSLYDILLS